MMFTQGLLQLVSGKLSSDIDEIMYRDDLFSHTVDEVRVVGVRLLGVIN